MTVARFEGGQRLVVRSGIAGGLALALTAAGAALDARRALFAYLVAFTYWVGIAVGALLLLMIFHASNARWPVVVRRVLESIPLSSALFLVLFLPVALGVRRLFPWVDLSGLAGEAAQAAAHRRPWLNVPFFLVRSAIYLGSWILVSHLLHGWSVRQDSSRDAALTLRQRRLGAGALPGIGLTLTFAAFDWQMSLEPRFYSTIFGVYYFAGSILAAIAVLILAAAWGRGPDFLGEVVRPSHFHSLGKFLLAFVSFWAYIAFSQFLLVWIANIPEEVPWYLVRDRRGWAPVGIFLVVFHFVVPFFILLSRDLKRRPRALAVMAVWVLVVHYVDVYWVMMPALHHDAPRPHWTDLTAFVGVGAAALAFTVWRMRGHPAVPVGDPYLEDSLRYDPQ